MAVSMNEIKSRLSACPPEAILEEIAGWREDERKGVQNLIQSAEKRYERFVAEEKRLDLLLCYERLCYDQGYALVAGVDEVGRGPLAGPVMAGAVILPRECRIKGINDSKKLTPKKREELSEIIREQAVSYAVGSVSPKRIDQINILNASLEAMTIALGKLTPKADFVLADAVTIPRLHIPQQGIIKGDAKSTSIGAASIIAKVERDRFMREMEELYPDYGFHENKGYGTQAHIAAIKSHGICPIHRLSFVKNFTGNSVPLSHNQQMGKEGEDIAAKQMRRMGYKIMERNYCAHGGEIDIIAQKNGVTVFTEVKHRTNIEKGHPCEAVNYKKQQHIIRVAKQYIAQNGLDGEFRFDVAEVAEVEGKKYFHYIENAFWS